MNQQGIITHVASMRQAAPFARIKGHISSFLASREFSDGPYLWNQVHTCRYILPSHQYTIHHAGTGSIDIHLFPRDTWILHIHVGTCSQTGSNRRHMFLRWCKDWTHIRLCRTDTCGHNNHVDIRSDMHSPCRYTSRHANMDWTHTHLYFPHNFDLQRK
jgi:hypothetical protein